MVRIRSPPPPFAMRASGGNPPKNAPADAYLERSEDSNFDVAYAISEGDREVAGSLSL